MPWTSRATKPTAQRREVIRPQAPGQTTREGLRDYAWALAAAFVVMSLFTAFIGRAYVIPSASMEPTLHGCAGCANDRVWVDKLAYEFGKPQPGDVIVFAGPPSWNTDFTARRSDNVLVRGAHNMLAATGLVPNTDNVLTKRVIATAGQTVQCLPGDAGVVVDGTVLNEPYLNAPGAPGSNPVDTAAGSEACGGAFFGPVTVPEDSVWVMGDNRTNSVDSRAHLGDELQGTVPLDNVRGKVRFIMFPLGRAGGVGNGE